MTDEVIDLEQPQEDAEVSMEDTIREKYLIASESAMETKEPATKPKRRKKESK